MNVVQQRLRRRQQAEGLSAAALRAITGRKQAGFERGRAYDADRLVPLYAPHLRLAPGQDTLASYRGVVDSVALRLKYSDSALHLRRAPEDPVERFLFEWLEQMRVESIVPDCLPGARSNLERCYRLWSNSFLGSGLTETSRGLLLFAFSQTVWSRLTLHELSDPVKDLFGSTLAALVPDLSGAFAGIRRTRHDQSCYSVYALKIAREFARRLRGEPEIDGGARFVRRGAFTLPLDFEQGDVRTRDFIHANENAVFTTLQRPYRVFTTKYDQEFYAPDLVRTTLLREYRERLDRRIARQGVNGARLARALQALLAHPQPDAWSFAREEGLIDGRRLAQLVSSPGERRLFRSDQTALLASCAVSFLIDCSGSMKRCIESAAVMVDVLTRALEQAGVITEILGFTTSAWSGGRVRQDWVAQGQPAGPGRLNEISHLVFKNANTSWRRARQPLAALLKADLFREGVDGEAVQWACQRLLAQACERRILVVISDGGPMDSATNLANDAFYLDDHLKSVIACYTQQYPLEIVGIGVGLDLSPYYRCSLSVDLAEGLDNSVFNDFPQLLGGRHRR